MTLEAADLVSMRAAQEVLLPDTCAVTRRTATADGLGGETWTWAQVGATIACRLSSHGAPQEYLQVGAVRGKTIWMVTLPYGTDVVREDRITISAQVLEVLGFASGGAWETAMRAACVEVS